MERTESLGKALVEILKSEYGITSMEELDREIARMEKIDVSIFCAPIEKRGGKNDERKEVSKRSKKLYETAG